MWTTDITLVKCSILLLYIQIFQAERFILGAKITIAAVVAWLVISPLFPSQKHTGFAVLLLRIPLLTLGV